MGVKSFLFFFKPAKCKHNKANKLECFRFLLKIQDINTE
jgi:hypothetical protein